MIGYQEDLTESEAMILYLLTTRYEFSIVKELAKDIGVKESHVKKALLNLKRRGLVDWLVFPYFKRMVCSFYPFSNAHNRLKQTLKTNLRRMHQTQEKIGPRARVYFAVIDFEKFEQTFPNYVAKIEQSKKS